MNYTVAIVGAGPAGATASIQLCRYGVDFILFEKGEVGGLLHHAGFVENFPGHARGISGTALAALFQNHLEEMNIKVVGETITAIYFSDGQFLVRSQDKITTCAYLVFATGTKPKPAPFWVDTSAESRIHNDVRKLLQMTCRKICVIGGGDVAFDYAVNLASTNNVTILSRSKPRCVPPLYRRAKEHSRIRIVEGIEVVSARVVKGQLVFDCLEGDKEVIVTCDEALLAIGRFPADDPLTRGIEEHIIRRLSADGKLYMAGDVANGLVRQAVVAAGDGMRAAMEIVRRVVG